MSGGRGVLLLAACAVACGGAPSPVSKPASTQAHEGHPMKYEFRVLQVPERPLMAIHEQARGGPDLSQKIIAGSKLIWPYLRSNQAETGHNVVVYRNYDRDAGVMTIDVAVQIAAAGLAGDGKIVPSSTPGGLVATTVHMGPYHELGNASSALHEFCKTHDHPIIGPTWEEYGDWSDDPSKLRTDVFVLIER